VPQNLERNEEIWRRLRVGENPLAIIADGFNRDTVYRTKKKVERGEQSPLEKRLAATLTPATLPSHSSGGSEQGVSASPASDTLVRLTQQQIVLPGAMFILYDHCRMLNPEYDVTPSQWLQDVVQCWAEDHAEELQLGPMTWTQNPVVRVNLHSTVGRTQSKRLREWLTLGHS